MITQLNEVMLDGLDYMKRVSKNLKFLTDAISTGNDEQIAKNYYDLREGFDWITGALEAFENHLHVDYANITICKKPAQKIIDEYLCFKNEADSMFNNIQYKELSEFIEKETPKQMKNLTSIFNKVKTIMNETHH